MGKIETQPWDVTDYLQDDADVVAYLEAALEDSDAAHVARALVNIARAKGALGALEKELQRQLEAAATT